MTITFPFHDEDKVILINNLFGKKAPAEGEISHAASESQLEVIVSEYNEISKAITEQNTDDLRDALQDLKVTLWGYPYLVKGEKLTYNILAALSNVHRFDQNSSIVRATAIVSALKDKEDANQGKEIQRRALIQDLVTSDEGWDNLEATLESTIAARFNRFVRAARKTSYDKAIAMVEDLLVRIYFLEDAIGIPAEQDFNDVIKSLVSRVCRNEEVAIATVERYAEKGITAAYHECEMIPGAFVVRVSETVTIDGEVYPKDKFLKSIEYTNPTFCTLPEATVFKDATPSADAPMDEQGNLIEAEPVNIMGEEEGHYQ